MNSISFMVCCCSDRAYQYVDLLCFFLAETDLL
jgi:hypothetical protein